MKHFLTLAIVVIFRLSSSLAQGIPDISEESASKAFGFIPNVGQVIDENQSQVYDLYFQSVHMLPHSYYFDRKISFVFPAFDKDTVLLKDSLSSLSRIDMSWITNGDNGNPAIPVPFEETLEKFNFYLDHCSTGCDDISKYKGLLYEDVYPGIDMRIYSNENWMKIYFVIAPGSDPDQIRLSFDGMDGITVTSNLIELNLGAVDMFIPSGFAYEYDAFGSTILPWLPTFNTDPYGVQMVAGGTTLKTLVYEISVPYFGKTSVTKNVDWSTYVGGEGTDGFYDVETNTAGDVHICGYTRSKVFPSTTGTTTSAYALTDLLLLKFKNDLADIAYTTIIGGTGEDGLQKYGLSLDENSHVYFATQVARGVPLKNPGDGSFFDNTTTTQETDQIVGELNESGIVVWSTYFGGAGQANSGDIVVDKVTGEIYFSGNDGLANFAVPSGAKSYSDNGSTGYLVKISANTTSPPRQLLWSTYFPAEYIAGLEIDANGRLLVTGMTQNLSSALAIETPTGYTSNVYAGGVDAFIARFNTDLSLNWTTFIGGSSNLEVGYRIMENSNGKIIVSGQTSSGNFPTSGVSQSAHGGSGSFTGGDAFVTVFSNVGALENSAWVGGRAGEAANGLASDAAGNIYVVGETHSDDFPFPSGQDPFFYSHTSLRAVNDNRFDPDCFLVGYSPDYNAKWGTILGGAAPLGATGSDVHKGSESLAAAKCWGNSTDGYYLYVVGYTQDEKFEPLHANGHWSHPYTYAKNGRDGLVMRFKLYNAQLGTEEFTNLKGVALSVFPNPSNQSITISSKNGFKRGQVIKIFDMLGKEIISQIIQEITSSPSIDISALPKGMYAVEVGLDGEKVVTKFVKN